MLKELIEKLKRKKHQIQSYKSDNDDINTGIKVHEEKEVEIIVSSQNNITKIEIPDYVCIGDFVDKKNYGEEYKIFLPFFFAAADQQQADGKAEQINRHDDPPFFLF